MWGVGFAPASPGNRPSFVARAGSTARFSRRPNPSFTSRTGEPLVVTKLSETLDFC